MYIEKQKKGLQDFLEEKYDTTLTTSTGLNGFSSTGLLMVVFDTSKESVSARVDNLKFQVGLAWETKDILKKSGIGNFDTPFSSYMYLLSQNLKKQAVIEIYEEGSFEGLYYIVMNDYIEEAIT